MANTKKEKKPIVVDPAKGGAMNAYNLQKINQSYMEGMSPEAASYIDQLYRKYPKLSPYDPYLNAHQNVASPFLSQTTTGGASDYWGRSSYDNPTANEFEFSKLGDIRAENQPWYSKLASGVGKGVVLAATTALETAGLVYGVGQMASNAFEGKNILSGLWDNPITNALKSLNDAAEDWMPNYYTQAEREDPWGHIFSANFIGDKLLKNFGFMVGAFYGGIPASSLLGKAGVGIARTAEGGWWAGKTGTSAVKAARRELSAEMQGLGKKFNEIAAEYSDDVIGKAGAYGKEIEGLSEEAAAKIGQKYGNEAVQAYERLAANGLTEGDRGRRMLEGLEKINNIAKATRSTTQVVGALGSAINEGAIEALNNSSDWAREQKKEAEDELESKLAEIEAKYSDPYSEEALREKESVSEYYQRKLQQIEDGRARVGNADLLLNIPVLLGSNLVQLGKLYSRGFDSTRRQMGSFWNGHKIFDKSNKTFAKGLLTSIPKSLTEGLEEYLQRAASDGSGKAVSDSIERYMKAGKSDSSGENVFDYISGFAEAIAENASNPEAWEEFFIGFLSSAIGMPVFGKQTKNSWVGKDNGVMGISGGIIGNMKEYLNKRDAENNVANYINERVKDPKFKEMYELLRKQDDYDTWMREEIAKGDKSKYYDLHLEKFYSDINAFASAGRLEELKQLIGYNHNYTDKELEEIADMTTITHDKESQKKQDTALKQELEKTLAQMEGAEDTEENKEFRKALEEQLAAVNERLNKDDYKNILEGPFVLANQRMDISDPDLMREKLERNRKKTLQGIEDYLKIRNEIDVETDGRLDDEQIGLLTNLKGAILDFERRSPEMADDIISNIGNIDTLLEDWAKNAEDQIELAQEKYDKAKEELNKASNLNDPALTKKYLEAKRTLEKEKSGKKGIDNAKAFIQQLKEEHSMDSKEQKAYKRGYGESASERAVNSEELQNILGNRKNTGELSQNVKALTSLIKMADLDFPTKKRLLAAAIDLGRLANLKIDYNRKFREYIGNPEKINEAFREHEDKLKAEERASIVDSVATNIKNARSMRSLHEVLKDSQVHGAEVLNEALNKAKETADEDTKKFLNDYEELQDVYAKLLGQVPSLPEDAAPGVGQTLLSLYEAALDEGIGGKDYLIPNIEGAIEDLKASGREIDFKVADGLKTILEKVKSNASASSTNSRVNTTGATNPARPTKNPPKNNSSNNNPPNNNPPKNPPQSDTPDSLKDAIIKEVEASRNKDGSFGVTKKSDLSSGLQKRIEDYELKNPGKKIEVDSIILNAIQDIDGGRGDIVTTDPNYNHTELGEASGEKDNSVKEEMEMKSRTSFRSPYVSEFKVADSDEAAEKKEEYKPEDNDPHKDVLLAVKKLLSDYKAYSFVDHNLLGYIYNSLSQKGETLKLNLLRCSFPEGARHPEFPVTFLAVEWKDEYGRAIKKALGTDMPNDISRIITIGTKRYQIVGTLTYSEKALQEVKTAFENLQGALNRELNPKIEEALNSLSEEDKKQPFFVVSDTLTVPLDTLFPGRLEKRDSGGNRNEKSLLEFLSESVEFSNGVDFPYGVNTGNEVEVTDNHGEKLVMPMDPTWYNTQKGAVLLFVPKPDGKHYPIRCSRITVKEWFDLSKESIDGLHTAEEILKDPKTNKYISNIVDLILKLKNSKTLAEKLSARSELGNYFILGERSPIRIYDNGIIALNMSDNLTSLSEKMSDDEFISKFFDFMRDNNVMFSIPFESDLTSRDLANSGIFKVGLNGFYNFNASIVVSPIDGSGTSIHVPTDSALASTGAGMSSTVSGYFTVDLDDGSGTVRYTHETTGGVRSWYIGDAKITDADKINLLNGLLDGSKKEQSMLSFMLQNSRFTPEKIDRLKELLSMFEDYIHIIQVGEELWIHDTRQGGSNNKYYRQASQLGEEIFNSWNKEYEKALETVNLEAKRKLDEELKRRREENTTNTDNNPQPPSSNNPPSPPAGPSGTGNTGNNRFVGKTVESLDKKTKIGSALSDLNKIDSQVAVSILEVLQSVEELGNPFTNISEEGIVLAIRKILKSPKEDREKITSRLISKIKCG